MPRAWHQQARWAEMMTRGSARTGGGLPGVALTVAGRRAPEEMSTKRTTLYQSVDQAIPPCRPFLAGFKRRLDAAATACLTKAKAFVAQSTAATSNLVPGHF